MEKKEIAHGNALSTSFLYIASSFFTASFVSLCYIAQSYVEPMYASTINSSLYAQFFAVDLVFLIQGLICLVATVITFYLVKD